MSRPGKTIVFGLDGFDLKHARRLADSGRLPWFSDRFSDGSLITTHCPELPGSEWVNAACGVSPAHHGYLHTSQLRVGTYEFVETDARVVRTDPFYVPLARAGCKTIVVDLCVDRPRPDAGLVQVIDWATEFKLFHYCTTPASLRKFVDRVCPDHPLTNYGGTDPGEANLRQLDQKLRDGTALKGLLIRHLLEANPDWSVLFAGFGEIHKAGHFFWQYQDPSHDRFEGDEHPLASAIDALYERTDQELMNICEAAGSGTNVIVIADRGMRANYRGDHLVQAVLQKLGLLRFKNTTVGGQPDSQHAAEGWQAPPGKSLAQRLKTKIPVRLRPLARQVLGKQQVDWLNTKVFTAPEVGNTYFRINLEGREPLGCVRQDEYAALLGRLQQEFASLVNPETGRSPVRELVFPRNTYTGPLRDELPDFGIVWEGDAPVRALVSPTLGRFEGTNVEQRSGNHTENGGVLLSGPDFKSGGARMGDLREFAPTLLALHGVRIPEWYEFPAMPELSRVPPISRMQ